MNKDIIKMKAKEYADGIRGLTHKKTASVDFEKGAQFVLESMKWRNAEKEAQLQISVAYFCSIGLYFLV